MAEYFNPLRTPLHSIEVTPAGSVYRRSVIGVGINQQQVKQRRLKSARLVGEYEKPWLISSPYKARERWDKVILWGCITIGFLVGVLLCYISYVNVPRHEYCLIMDDDFANLDNWTRELQLAGFGTGAFDWTTDDPLNSYISSDGLHIVPTLTLDTTSITPDQLLDGYTLNLTSCTSTFASDCSVTSNATTSTIINPVRSARLSTKGKKSIKYGRVEVVAKLPAGDWLWPAIWMLPEDSVYGVWPISGEVDLMEARGNDPHTYPNGGRDTITSTLHWGLDSSTDMFQLTNQKHTLRRSDYSQGYHKYGLEWSEKYLYTFVDNRLVQVLSVGFGKVNMWTRSGLAKKGYVNDDPWSQTGRYNTPFDQNFYLILNVAVGSTRGYFGDSIGGKPWVDEQPDSAAFDFWKANSTWLKTWGAGDKRGMTVRSVKVWQEGAC